MIHVYTDGSCHNKPGEAMPMTYACVIDIGIYRWLLAAYEPPKVENTNNRAEISAALLAFAAMNPGKEPVTIHTDSQYLMKGATSQNRVNANADLMMMAIHGTKIFGVRWKHVRGHTGHPENELADSLCHKAMTLGDPSWDGARTVICELQERESGTILLSKEHNRRIFQWVGADGTVWEAKAALF